MSLSPRLRFASVVTIAAVTAGLLFRLALPRTGTVPSAPSTAPTTRDAQASPLPVPPISPAWKIAYECQDDICIAHPDDTQGTPILHKAGQPSWSPDRTQLAFAREGNVWIAGADGSHQRQITFWPTDKDYPINGISWDIKDNLLSFGRREKLSVTLPGGKTRNISGMTLFHASLTPVPDTRHFSDPRFPFAVPARLTPTSWGDYRDEAPHPLAPRFDITENRTPFVFGDNDYPAWSASGDALAWVRNGDIWLATREDDMWDAKRIVANAEYDDSTVGGSRWTISATDISWAPDTSYFVFSNRRNNGSGVEDLHIVHKRTVTDDNGDKNTQYDDSMIGDGLVPSVSPDGHWILYTRQRALRAATPDGKNEHTVLADAWGGVW